MNKLVMAVLVSSLVSISASAQVVTGPILPDATLTPGKANVLATESSLCAVTFRTGSVRNVTTATKNKVFANYKVKNHTGYCGINAEGCEVDHLISLELGGTNDVANLWPQSYVEIPGQGHWDAHKKDALENRLHAMVCTGKISLPQAQQEISTDWIKAYKKYVDPNAK
jgi:hypothetical protein